MMRSDGRGSERGGLYIHVPFCRTKCQYCNFYSTTDAPNDDWLDALLGEAHCEASRFGALDTLYLGGGTPSVLSGDLLERLMRGLWDMIDLAPDAELTIEVNPDDITGVRLDRWLTLGFDRLSIGVQSFNDDELGFLGRRHTAQQTLDALELARAAGVTNLGLDLIFGLPDIDAAAWSRNLDQALSFEPEHLSCYQLTVTPDTPLGHRVGTGEVALPDEERCRELFLITAETLGAAGYDHYEISNFARAKELRSRHNLKYWSRIPVLGLGPGAHSSRGHTRWWNVDSVRRYIDALESSKSPRQDSEELTFEQLLLEDLMLGFRTKDGVSLETLSRIPGFETMLLQLVDEGLITVCDERAKPTVEGYLLADGLPLRFEV